jgi:hypothetical protein
MARLADVKSAEDLALPTPDLSRRPDGVRGPRIVIIEPTEQVRAYLTRLGERAETVKSRGVDSDRGQHAENRHRRAQGHT